MAKPLRRRASYRPDNETNGVTGMEAVAETLIGTYLTRGGRVFIVPQYSIPPSPDSKGEWSCPDFVALDFEREPREVVVVEVTTASNI